MWQEEFAGIYDCGGICTLTMHPQLIGRPARIAMLGQFLDYVQTFDGVLTATCAEIADFWAESNPV